MHFFAKTPCEKLCFPALRRSMTACTSPPQLSESAAAAATTTTGTDARARKSHHLSRRSSSSSSSSSSPVSSLSCNFCSGKNRAGVKVAGNLNQVHNQYHRFGRNSRIPSYMASAVASSRTVNIVRHFHSLDFSLVALLFCGLRQSHDFHRSSSSFSSSLLCRRRCCCRCGLRAI